MSQTPEKTAKALQQASHTRSHESQPQTVPCNLLLKYKETEKKILLDILQNPTNHQAMLTLFQKNLKKTGFEKRLPNLVKEMLKSVGMAFRTKQTSQKLTKEIKAQYAAYQKELKNSQQTAKRIGKELIYQNRITIYAHMSANADEKTQSDLVRSLVVRSHVTNMKPHLKTPIEKIVKESLTAIASIVKTAAKAVQEYLSSNEYIRLKSLEEKIQQLHQKYSTLPQIEKESVTQIVNWEKVHERVLLESESKRLSTVLNTAKKRLKELEKENLLEFAKEIEQAIIELPEANLSLEEQCFRETLLRRQTQLSDAKQIAEQRFRRHAEAIQKNNDPREHLVFYRAKLTETRGASADEAWFESYLLSREIESLNEISGKVFQAFQLTLAREDERHASFTDRAQQRSERIDQLSKAEGSYANNFELCFLFEDRACLVQAYHQVISLIQPNEHNPSVFTVKQEFRKLQESMEQLKTHKSDSQSAKYALLYAENRLQEYEDARGQALGKTYPEDLENIEKSIQSFEKITATALKDIPFHSRFEACILKETFDTVQSHLRTLKKKPTVNVLEIVNEEINKPTMNVTDLMAPEVALRALKSELIQIAKAKARQMLTSFRLSTLTQSKDLNVAIESLARQAESYREKKYTAEIQTLLDQQVTDIQSNLEAQQVLIEGLKKELGAQKSMASAKQCVKRKLVLPNDTFYKKSIQELFEHLTLAQNKFASFTESLDTGKGLDNKLKAIASHRDAIHARPETISEEHVIVTLYHNELNDYESRQKKFKADAEALFKKDTAELAAIEDTQERINELKKRLEGLGQTSKDIHRRYLLTQHLSTISAEFKAEEENLQQQIGQLRDTKNLDEAQKLLSGLLEKATDYCKKQLNSIKSGFKQATEQLDSDLKKINEARHFENAKQFILQNKADSQQDGSPLLVLHPVVRCLYHKELDNFLTLLAKTEETFQVISDGNETENFDTALASVESALAKVDTTDPFSPILTAELSVLRKTLDIKKTQIQGLLTRLPQTVTQNTSPSMNIVFREIQHKESEPKSKHRLVNTASAASIETIRAHVETIEKSWKDSRKKMRLIIEDQDVQEDVAFEKAVLHMEKEKETFLASEIGQGIPQSLLPLYGILMDFSTEQCRQGLEKAKKAKLEANAEVKVLTEKVFAALNKKHSMDNALQILACHQAELPDLPSSKAKFKLQFLQSLKGSLMLAQSDLDRFKTALEQAPSQASIQEVAERETTRVQTKPFEPDIIQSWYLKQMQGLTKKRIASLKPKSPIRVNSPDAQSADKALEDFKNTFTQFLQDNPSASPQQRRAQLEKMRTVAQSDASNLAYREKYLQLCHISLESLQPLLRQAQARQEATTALAAHSTPQPEISSGVSSGTQATLTTSLPPLKNREAEWKKRGYW